MLLFSLFSPLTFAYYEARPAVRMSEVLKPQQAQSVYHRVEDIELGGKFYKFRVDTEMGVYDIRSMAMFRNRIQEISTLIQAMSQFDKQDEALSDELGAQFSIRANSAVDILSRPVESAANLAGQFANNLEDTFSGTRKESGAVPGYLVQELNDPVAAMHKRNIASQWGLDVYSSNLNVQGFLNSVTRARSAGKISAGTPTLRSQINRPPKSANIDLETELLYIFKNKGVDELENLNRHLLSAMKINNEVIDTFLNHPAFSPRHKTRITHYLNGLRGVRNRSAFIEAAHEVQDEVMALAFEESAMMLKYYHDKIQPLEKLFAGNDVLEAITRDRRILYFVPVDVIYWSEQTERLFLSLRLRAEKSGFSAWELITAGTLTEEASNQLKNKNFVLRANFNGR